MSPVGHNMLSKKKAKALTYVRSGLRHIGAMVGSICYSVP